jgi:hypothetical protein
MARKIMYVGDTDIVNKSLTNLLEVAKKKLNKVVLNEFRDEVGRFGFEIENFLVCAKKSPYGYIVSTHRTLVELAIQKYKKILMYLGENDAFYEVDPKEIIKTGTINKRGHEEFWNFDIKLGKRFEIKKEFL